MIPGHGRSKVAIESVLLLECDPVGAGAGAGGSLSPDRNLLHSDPIEIMVRDRSRGNRGGAKRSTPYEGAQQSKKEGGGGRSRGGRGARGARDGGGKGKGAKQEKPKPKTAEELDREMDSYWGKSEEHASKKLDGDMDDYWKKKGDTRTCCSAAIRRGGLIRD